MIVVFGSINIDLIMQVKHFPTPGETVMTPSYEWLSGGKGMNQAIAAARAGVKVAMVGRVGDDGFGTRALNAMRRESILTSGVIQSESLPTGCATILIDETGENEIVVSLGANAEVDATQVPDEILGPSNLLLLQMELPAEANWDVLKRAAARGATTILNLAPANELPREALSHLDYLIVNRIEAEQIATKLGLKIETDALKLAYALSKNCDLTCIITLSGRGAVAVSGSTGWVVPALKVDTVVDTTGAGDTFCGVFAAAIHQKLSLPDALRRASVAGSLSIKGKGAQTAMPYIDDIVTYLPQLPEPEMVKL
ncbi:MAG: ribokinase [Alphaproteobacteria bacterium]|nr:ribokinase [Alphaproteobacteria bacterium]